MKNILICFFAAFIIYYQTPHILGIQKIKSDWIRITDFWVYFSDEKYSLSDIHKFKIAIPRDRIIKIIKIEEK